MSLAFIYGYITIDPTAEANRVDAIEQLERCRCLRSHEPVDSAARQRLTKRLAHSGIDAYRAYSHPRISAEVPRWRR